MRILFAVLAATVTVASGLVRSYFVEPKSAALSGWTDTTPGRDYVSEVVTCCWDELDSASGSYVELFAGETLTGKPYKLDVYEYPDGVFPVASHSGKQARRGHAWLKFPLTVTSGYTFTKGKQYEFRFTRSGSDSIQFYYAENAYDYGHIVIGGGQLQTPPGSAPDRACPLLS
jgi:hypothetical protein